MTTSSAAAWRLVPRDGNDGILHRRGPCTAFLVGTMPTQLIMSLFDKLSIEVSAGATDGDRAGWLTMAMAAGAEGALLAVESDDATLATSVIGRVSVLCVDDEAGRVLRGADEAQHVRVTPGTSIEISVPALDRRELSFDTGTLPASGAVLRAAEQASADSADRTADGEPIDAGASESATDELPVAERRSPDGRINLSELPAPRAPLPLDDDGAEPDRASPGPEPVVVRGIKCRNGHHNHLDARLCSLCGDNMQNVSVYVTASGGLGELGVRPPLGILTFDDGEAYQVGNDVVIGRAPITTDPATTTIEFPDDNTMSREHVMIELNDWEVNVRDLGSSNGTLVRFEPSGQYVTLDPNITYPLPNSAVIVVGSKWATFTATSAAPASH